MDEPIEIKLKLSDDDKSFVPKELDKHMIDKMKASSKVRAEFLIDGTEIEQEATFNMAGFSEALSKCKT